MSSRPGRHRLKMKPGPTGRDRLAALQAELQAASPAQQAERKRIIKEHARPHSTSGRPFKCSLAPYRDFVVFDDYEAAAACRTALQAAGAGAMSIQQCPQAADDHLHLVDH